MMDIGFVLKQLFAAYPNNKVTEGTVAVYVARLQDIPLDELQIAVNQCINECKFMPTVAEIREMWAGLTYRAGQLTSAEAWDMVRKEMSATGYYGGKPQFENALVARVVAILGWRNLLTSENPMVDRAHFMKMYEQLLERSDMAGRLTPQARQLADSYRAEKLDAGLKRLGMLS